RVLAEHAAHARAARGRRPRLVRLPGEEDDRRKPRAARQRLERAGRGGARERHDHARRLEIVDGVRQLRGRDEDYAPVAPAAQLGFDDRGALLAARDDEHRRRAGHRDFTPAARTKRSTRVMGMARARAPATMAFSPITRPEASASGPPELPGASRTSAWIQSRPPG